MVANAVEVIPAENKVPPIKAIFLNPKVLSRTPLNRPSVIPSAEFKLRIKVASIALKFSSLNLSLNIRPKLVKHGIINSYKEVNKINDKEYKPMSE